MKCKNNPMNHEKTLDVRSNPAPPSGLADFADPVRLPGQQSAREDVVKCDQTSTIARGIADTVPPRLTHLPVVQAVVQNRQNRQDVQNARGLLEAGWLQGLLALAGHHVINRTILQDTIDALGTIVALRKHRPVYPRLIDLQALNTLVRAGRQAQQAAVRYLWGHCGWTARMHRIDCDCMLG